MLTHRWLPTRGAALAATVVWLAITLPGANVNVHGSGDPALGVTLPAVTFITVDDQRVPLLVEVADGGRELACGLMYRSEMPENHGMIFVYQTDLRVGVYMRNTLIPLSAAFVTADGVILDIQDMEPVPEPGLTPYRLIDGSVVNIRDDEHVPPGATYVIYSPSRPYRYFIETNVGWFQRNGISIGDRVDVSAALANADAAAPPPVSPC